MLFVAGGRPGDGTVDFAYLFDGGRYLVTQAGDFGFDVGDEACRLPWSGRRTRCCFRAARLPAPAGGRARELLALGRSRPSPEALSEETFSRKRFSCRSRSGTRTARNSASTTSFVTLLQSLLVLMGTKPISPPPPLEIADKVVAALPDLGRLHLVEQGELLLQILLLLAADRREMGALAHRRSGRRRRGNVSRGHRNDGAKRRRFLSSGPARR